MHPDLDLHYLNLGSRLSWRTKSQAMKRSFRQYLFASTAMKKRFK